MMYLHNNSMSLQFIYLQSDDSSMHGSDEAIADYIEIAGRSLEELSLNHVRQVCFSTKLRITKYIFLKC